MANSDGQVRIIIDTNAQAASKALDTVEKSFNKTAKTVKDTTTVYNAYEQGINSNIEALREMALAGGQNSKEFQRLAEQTKEYKRALEEANQAIEKSTSITNNTVQNTSKSFMDLEVAGVKVGTALKGITYIAVARKLYEIGQQALQTAAEFEQLEVSFKIMAGGAAQGERLTQSLINLANKTPMTTEGLARATQTLLSFGESSDNIIKDLQLLGDISGGQEQRFQSLALAFAQVGSTGRLTGQDLLQMVNQGFNPLQVISEKTGKSMATLKKEMGEGKISFDMVKQAMIDATSEGGRFYGLMNEQSGTLNGLLSTNADTWQQVSKNIGDGFMPVAKEAVRVLIALGNAILNLQRKMSEFQKEFAYKTVDSAAKKAEGMFKEAQKYRDLAAKEEERAAKWQGKRPTEGMLARAESYRKQAAEFEAAAKRFSASANEIKKAEAEANKPSTSGGFGSGGSGNVTSASAEKIKDAFEKAQEEAQKAEKAFKLALYQSGGNITPAVEKARLKMVDTKKAVEDVQKAYERLTATAKTPFEQLNYNIEQSRQKIISLASQPIVNIEAIRQAQAEYQGFLAQQEQINAYLQPAKGHLEELNLKIQETQRLLGELYFTKGVNSEEFIKAKNELVQLQTTAKNVNTAISSQVGVDWANISESIKSNLSSAILTPLQEGESAFDRLAKIGLNAVQLVGQEIIKNLMEQITLEQTLAAIKTAGKAIGSFFGFGFKDGGVFQNGNVIPFAKGGVVNKPTIFPMANGGTGLMGEAGAEAVMPLRRMSNGRLGVEAENNNGKAVQVNIYNQSGASVETRKRDDGSMDVFIRKVNEALSSERTASGFRSAYAREDKKGVQAV